MVEYEDMVLADYISSILNTRISEEEYEALERDWAAFCENPSKYADTIVVDLVKFYLKDRRETTSQDLEEQLPF